MREQAEARLKELRAEFEAGQARLDELEREATRLRETLLRISGAAQVLHELLAAGEPPGGERDREAGAAGAAATG